MLDVHRLRHLDAGRRSVKHESRMPDLPDNSASTRPFTSSPTHSSNNLEKAGSRWTAFWPAWRHCRPPDREILVMKYLEQLSAAEIAEALGISERAVKARHLRTRAPAGRDEVGIGGRAMIDQKRDRCRKVPSVEDEDDAGLNVHPVLGEVIYVLAGQVVAERSGRHRRLTRRHPALADSIRQLSYDDPRFGHRRTNYGQPAPPQMMIAT